MYSQALAQIRARIMADRQIGNLRARSHGKKRPRMKFIDKGRELVVEIKLVTHQDCSKGSRDYCRQILSFQGVLSGLRLFV